jgi:murein hydrolase activator
MRQAGVVIVCLLFATGLAGQSLEELQNRKQKAEDELEYTGKLLENARSNEQASLTQLRLINRTINQRNEIIEALIGEVHLIQDFIANNTLVVALLEEDLQALKEEYASMIVFAYKNREIVDHLFFLLSSRDFNQAYKRHLYVKQYAEYRKIQAHTIGSMQELLGKKAEDLMLQKAEKDRLLSDLTAETDRLREQKNKQNAYIRKMQQEQQFLRQKIREQQRVEQELEERIHRMIEEEAREARDAGGPGFALTPEQQLINDDFGQNKNRMPWPVERGIIVEEFGLQKHPTLENITIRNNGVDIATEPNAKARVVFDGEVSRVFAISGGNMAVIVRHGTFLTVYSNLAEVTVKAGDRVFAKQPIGTIYTDPDKGNRTILKFQVWFENRKMDPKEWIVQ